MLLPNTYAFELLLLLAVVGEYPRKYLGLVGNDRMLKRVIVNGKKVLDICLDSGAEFKAKLFCENGKGKDKSLRLHRDAIAVLEAMDSAAANHYMKTYHHHFSTEKVSRRHRVAESVAMMRAASIEYRPYILPKLQDASYLDITPKPSFYLARDLKAIDDMGINKTAYTRIVGALFTAEKIYAVYNPRNLDMKWVTMGEQKAKGLLENVGRFNAGITTIDSAILLSNSLEAVIATIVKPRKNNREAFRLDRIFSNIHYVPPDANGIMILSMMALAGWKQIILNALFPKAMQINRHIDRECDAIHDGKYILSMLDCNIARLQRLKDFISFNESLIASSDHEIICYDFQAAAIEEYMEGLATIRPIAITEIETLFGCAP